MNPPPPEPVDDALLRRVALRLVPFLALCYVVAMIDRLNVGYAKLQFMADLGFDEADFGFAAGSLYVGYILFEIPSNWMLQRVGLRRTLLRIMVPWGALTMAMACAQSRTAFYALRFLIGAAEAGFFPGLVYYVTLWFPAGHRARVISWFALAVPLSGVIGAPVSVAVMGGLNGVAGLHGWQWLFLVEGLPAIVLGLLAYGLLDDVPARARFLDTAQKARMARLLGEEPPGAAARVERFAEVLRRPRFYALALVYFAFYSAQSVLLLWVPTLLRNAGAADLAQIGWRSATVFAAGALGMTALAWHSDRRGERRIHLLFSGGCACAAYALLPLFAGSLGATHACLMVAAATMFAFLALFWTVPTAELGPAARAGGIALVSSIGATGSALSPVFLGTMRVATGSLYGAIGVLAAAFFAALVLLGWMLRPGRALGAAPQASAGQGRGA